LVLVWEAVGNKSKMQRGREVPLLLLTRGRGFTAPKAGLQVRGELAPSRTDAAGGRRTPPASTPSWIFMTFVLVLLCPCSLIAPR